MFNILVFRKSYSCLVVPIVFFWFSRIHIISELIPNYDTTLLSSSLFKTKSARQIRIIFFEKLGPVAMTISLTFKSRHIDTIKDNLVVVFP